MNKLYFLILVLLFIGFKISKAGNSPCEEHKEGYINLETDYRLDSLIVYMVRNNESDQSMRGFRIQVDLGYNRSRALELQSRVYRKIPDVPTYIVYEQPYFKLRIGDFRTRIDALSLYRDLSEEFSNLFVVPDRINFPEL